MAMPTVCLEKKATPTKFPYKDLLLCTALFICYKFTIKIKVNMM